MVTDNLDIAIIGMSGQFPGADNLHVFWNNLVTGTESLRHLSPDELTQAQVPESESSRSDYVPVAGVLNNIDMFAGDFFGYAPREASYIDPQQRKMLEHAWHALEDAGINPQRDAATIGVYVGSSLNSYLLNNILSHPDIRSSDDLQQILFSNGQDYLATRIAYLFNLRGPAINIQTACSTSLVAVHEACQHLLSCQVDVAIAGGVSISCPQAKGYLYSVDGMLSPDGHCRPFSAQAEGTVFSSGLGVVVLKRLNDALTDGDAIYAVIKGSAVNNDGQQKVGYTAPSVDGQAEVIALAQGLANVSPQQVSYIETHGTATALGDQIEMAALQKVFANGSNKQTCAIGSLKSNIGHLDVAAGIAGLIKTTLALQHRQIPATLHCQTPTSKVNWPESPFFVNDTLCNWDSASGEHYAGVSSFGIGGTNAHVILADAPRVKISKNSDGRALFVFSAKKEDELKEMLRQFCDYIRVHNELPIHGIARTLQEGRVEWSWRAAYVVQSLADAIEQISARNDSIICLQQASPVTPKVLAALSIEDWYQLREQWLQGHQIEWFALYANEKPDKVRLPGYSFSRKRYWIEPFQPHEMNPVKKQNTDEWFYAPGWRRHILSEAIHPGRDDTLLVLSFSNDFSNGLLSRLQQKTKCIHVFAGEAYQQKSDGNYVINPASPQDYIELMYSLKNRNLLPSHVLHAFSLTDKFQETDRAIFDAQQQYGLLSTLYFIQAWEKTVAEQLSLKLTILTNRLNELGNAGRVEPHKATLMAAVKVIPKEYVKIATQLIDIDAIDHSQFSICQQEQLYQEIFKQHYTEEEIVYRGALRFVRDYFPTPIKKINNSDNSMVAIKTVLITGGLGQLGLDIADYFANRKQFNIVLLARTVVPPENEWGKIIETYDEEHPLRLMLQRIISMKKVGACVRAYSADVGDEIRFKAVVQQIETEMGAITGVIHAAGETVNGIISLKEVSSLEESYQAKVFGTYQLFEAFQNKKLDFMILCSSMNAIIGGLGQLDNTAANAFIDYMADYIAGKTGMNVFAINWGAINVNRPMKVNVLHQFADLSTEHKKNRMTDDEVNEVYDRLLAQRIGSRIVISTIDMNTVLKSWNRVSSIEELTKDRPAYQTVREDSLSQEDAPKTDMQNWVKERWQQLLGLDLISIKDDFFSMGGHSLAAVQFVTKIKQTFNLKLHVMNLYEMPVLEQFSDYLDKQLKSKTRVNMTRGAGCEN